MMTIRDLTWPVPGYYKVSSGYADWRDYGLHGGFDIPAPNVPCVALGSGIVIWQGWAGSAGRSVYLDLGAGCRAHYCHLSAFNVTAGQVVDAGQVIGIVGGSGHGVDNYYGSHLHLNLFTATQPATGPSHWVAWVGKWAVDPELYLSKEVDVAGPTQQQIIDNLWARMAAIEKWFGAHMKAHQDTFDPNIRNLNVRVKALEARPAGSGIKRGDTVNIKGPLT